MARALMTPKGRPAADDITLLPAKRGLPVPHHGALHLGEPLNTLSRGLRKM